MKLSFRQIEPFVKSPDPAARVILIYGPDSGLMKERSKLIAATVVADINDPFNVAILQTSDIADDPSRLNDEAFAMSMMGGDRLIRIEDGGDKLTQTVKTYLEKPNDQALIIIEAGELTPRSSLRLLCEKAKNAASLPCYVEDERDIARLIRETLQAENLSAEPDAVTWLSSSITGDRGKARSELDKLITYKGTDKTPVTLNDVQSVCGVAGAQNLDDLIYAVGGRQVDKALKSYHTLLNEGMALIAILRAMQNHFRRLHLTKSKLVEGTALEQAVKSLSPPIFFKQEPLFKAQVERWSLPALEKILIRLSELEAQSKQTGTPAETLTAQAILGIALVR